MKKMKRIKNFKIMTENEHQQGLQIKGRTTEGDEFYIRYKNGNYLYCDNGITFSLTIQDKGNILTEKALYLAGLSMMKEE